MLAALSLAGELGFEPRQADPESAVLPLHHSPIESVFDDLPRHSFPGLLSSVWRLICPNHQRRESVSVVVGKLNSSGHSISLRHFSGCQQPRQGNSGSVRHLPPPGVGAQILGVSANGHVMPAVFPVPVPAAFGKGNGNGENSQKRIRAPATRHRASRNTEAAAHGTRWGDAAKRGVMRRPQRANEG